MAVDEFKVIIKAELDNRSLDIAGSGFGKAAKKHLEDSIKTTSGNSGGIASSLSGLLKKGASGAGNIGESLSGLLGSKSPMVLKLGVIGGILLMVFNVLKSLAPIVAILKLVEAVLTLTLYPIAMLLLNIVKPILFLLLKYVIIPFGSFLGLWSDPNKKGLSDLVGGNSGVGFIDEAYNLGTILGPIIAKYGADFGRFFVKSGADFGRWLSETWSDIRWWWWDITKGFNEWWSGIKSGFGIWWSSIEDGFDNWWSGIKSGFGIWWSDIKGGFDIWSSNMVDLFNDVKSNIIGISWDDITNRFSIIKSDIINIKWNDITNKFNNIKSNIVGISWSDITNIWINIKTEIINIFSDIVDGITNILNPLLSLVNKKVTSPSIGGGGGGASSGGGGGGGLTGTIIPGKSEKNWTDPFMKDPYVPDYWSYAEGGIAKTPQIAKIAERGPEVILSLDKLKNLVGGGQNTININIDKVEKEVDIDYLINKIERTLYSNGKRSGAF